MPACFVVRERQERLLSILRASLTKERDPFALEAYLQVRGVPANAVRILRELADGPQLVYRDHFARLTHPKYGTTMMEGSRFRLLRTPAHVTGHAPTIGCDNQYVLETILGYSKEWITGLAAAGVLE